MSYETTREGVEMQKKSLWLGIVPTLFSSLIFIGAAPAQAADPCIPDSIGTSTYAVHPGQKMSLTTNGAPLATNCTTNDLGVVGVTYGSKNPQAKYSSGSLTSSLTNWKWKNFSYEDLVAMLTEAKITDKIDPQSLFSIAFARQINGAVSADPTTYKTFGIVLDPTPAGPCHPDTVSGSETLPDTIVHNGDSFVQKLNGVSTPAQCTTKDPGWLYVGYVPPGTTDINNAYFAFNPDWVWGGSLTYDWITQTLAAANPPFNGPIESGAKFEFRYFRGGDATTPPDLATYSFVFSGGLDPSPRAPSATTSNNSTSDYAQSILTWSGDFQTKTTSWAKVSGSAPKPTNLAYKKWAAASGAAISDILKLIASGTALVPSANFAKSGPEFKSALALYKKGFVEFQQGVSSKKLSALTKANADLTAAGKAFTKWGTDFAADAKK